MNVKDLKRQIMGLAFEDEASMQEYRDIVNDAINRAIHEVHSTVRPILASYVIEQDGKGSGFVRYDMPELTKDGEQVTFMDFANRVTLGDNTITDCRTENRRVLLLPATYQGLITVWYKKIPYQITEETPPETELELDYEVHFLVPHLAAYYVWLDDDERKASGYYNRYEDLRQPMMSKPTAVITGLMW